MPWAMPISAVSAPRLSSKVWVGALVRRVNAAGGFATVIKRGEAAAGSVLLALRGPERTQTLLTRVNLGDGRSAWQPVVSNRPEDGEDVARALEKRRNFDPDLWIVELDVADPARFIDDEVLEP